MAYDQHQSHYNAFWSVRKTYDQPSETSKVSVHLFSKQSVPGLQTSTRYYKNRNGEMLGLTGVFLDGISEEHIVNIDVQAEKKLDNGVVIPEQIVVDFTCPTPGKIDRLQMSADSKWGNDFATKVVAMDFATPVSIRPFSFVPEGSERSLEGLSITQGENKIVNQYVQFDKEGKKVIGDDGFPVNINGTEQFNELSAKAREESNDKLRKQAWTNYFTAVNVFLIEEMMKHVSKAEFPVIEAPAAGAPDYPEDEINPEDVPF